MSTTCPQGQPFSARRTEQDLTLTDTRNIDTLRLDGGTQPRAQIDMFTVQDYADAMLDGAVFPAVVAFYDGTDRWLADGFHRVEAAKLADVDLEVDVRQGTRREAVLYSVGANANHGLRRTNEDKRRAVMTLLTDDEWRVWSDREIARRAGVSPDTVNRLRASLPDSDSKPAERVYVDRYGAERTMNTANIGGARPAAAAPAVEYEPDDEADYTDPLDPSGRLTADDIYRADLADYRNPEPGVGQGPADDSSTHGGDEWYTPGWLFEALAIDFEIDVCSPEDRTHVSVPAAQWYTIHDDGLAQPWHGTIWCNPPYSDATPWAQRCIKHGDGLLLTHIPMNAKWCADVWQACDAVRLFQGMEFVRPDGQTQRPAYWLQLAAFGPKATAALARLTAPPHVAENPRRVPSPMWVPQR